MQLVVPVAAALQEGIALILAPRHVLLLQQMPLVGPLLRRQLRMGIADMLEFVHGHAEGHKGQRLLQVGEAELVRLIAEEPLGIGIGKLLHGHGVNFGNVGRLAVVVRDGLAAHGHIAGKGVAKLVGQHLHIKDRVVEAGEDKGGLQAGQARHVTGGCLARLVLQIHQLMVDHEIDELAGLRADLVVHLLGSLHHEGIVARGLGVSVREDHFLIVPHDVVDAEALCLRVIELLAQRHEEGAHLLAEGCDLLFAVVRAALLEIADGDVVLIAEVLAHLVADADQLVPDLLQTRLVVLVEFGVGPDGSGAHGAVGVLKILLHAVEVQRLAVEGNFRSRHNLLIFVGQAALLLAQRDVGLAEQLLLQIHGDKILLAEFLLNVRAERAGRDGLAQRDLLAAEGRQRVVKIGDLRFIEFITGVQRMADVRDGILRGQLAVFAVHLKKQRAQSLVALRVFDRSFPILELCAVCIQIGALIFQGRKSEIVHGVPVSPHIL